MLRRTFCLEGFFIVTIKAPLAKVPAPRVAWVFSLETLLDCKLSAFWNLEIWFWVWKNWVDWLRIVSRLWQILHKQKHCPFLLVAFTFSLFFHDYPDPVQRFNLILICLHGRYRVSHISCFHGQHQRTTKCWLRRWSFRASVARSDGRQEGKKEWRKSTWAWLFLLPLVLHLFTRVRVAVCLLSLRSRGA